MTTAVAWLEPALKAHLRLAAVGTVACTILWLASLASGAWLETAILAVLVCVLGLPHGALDFIAGRAVFRRRFGVLWPIAFGASYVGLAALVFAGWLIAPGPWLAAMLALSVYHFGSDDDDPRFLRGLARISEIVGRGGAVILVPAAFHREEVALAFGYLMPSVGLDQSRAFLDAGLVWCGPLVALCWVGAITTHAATWLRGGPHAIRHRGALLEMTCVAAAFALLPPLVAFTLYFCGWHSLRQILILSAQLDHRGPGFGLLAFAQQAALPTLATIIVGGAAWLHAVSGTGQPLSTLIAVVFVTLFCLTVPHVVLHEIHHRQDVRRLRPIERT